MNDKVIKLSQGRLTANIITGLIYLLFAQIGFLFFLPYDLGTLVWPSVGVAFVLMLHFGYHVWPGIFLAVIIGNIHSTFYGDIDAILNFISTPSMWLDQKLFLFYALGSTSQAIIANWLVRKYTCYPQLFINPKKIIKFYLLAGPAASIFSATLCTIAKDLDSINEFVYSWMIWWIGDCFSIMIFGTIFIALIHFREKRRIVVCSLSIAALMIATIIYQLGLNWNNDRHDFIFKQQVDQMTNALTEQFDEYNALIISMNGFLLSQNTLIKHEFEIFTRQFLPHNPTVQAASFSELVAKDEVEEFENTLFEIYGEHFRVRNRNGILLTDKEKYAVIKFSESSENYPNTVGFDISSGFETGEALIYAAEFNSASITAPLESPVTPGRNLIILYYPYVKDGELKGYSALVVHVFKLMNSIIEKSFAQNVDFILKDIQDPDNILTVYKTSENDVFIGDIYEVNIPIFNRQWTIGVVPKAQFEAENNSAQPFLIGLTSMFVAGLFCIWMIVVTGHRYFLEELINRRTRALDDANKAKSEFMANMSHDLRTPLNAIIGFSDIMQKEMYGKMGPEKYLEYSKDINQSSQYLLSLINEILDFSELEAAKRTLEKEDADLESIIDQCIRTLNPLRNDKDITLEVNIPDDISTLNADIKAIKQILINVISNSIKFTDVGGKISVSVYQENKKHFITVRDNGVGIAQKDILRILKPFARVENDPLKPREGTGLGLSIVNSLVSLHGGKIEIQSEVNKGTTVIISLPSN